MSDSAIAKIHPPRPSPQMHNHPKGTMWRTNVPVYTRPRQTNDTPSSSDDVERRRQHPVRVNALRRSRVRTERVIQTHG